MQGGGFQFDFTRPFLIFRCRLENQARRAVVRFANPQDARTALRLSGAMIVDRFITVMPIASARASGAAPTPAGPAPTADATATKVYI
jgi:hypothetical protein